MKPQVKSAMSNLRASVRGRGGDPVEVQGSILGRLATLRRAAKSMSPLVMSSLDNLLDEINDEIANETDPDEIRRIVKEKLADLDNEIENLDEAKDEAEQAATDWEEKYDEAHREAQEWEEKAADWEREYENAPSQSSYNEMESERDEERKELEEAQNEIAKHENNEAKYQAAIDIIKRVFDVTDTDLEFIFPKIGDPDDADYGGSWDPLRALKRLRPLLKNIKDQIEVGAIPGHSSCTPGFCKEYYIGMADKPCTGGSKGRYNPYTGLKE